MAGPVPPFDRPTTDSPRAPALRELRTAAREGMVAVRTGFRSLLRAPEYRRLRWILLVGLVVRAVLVPLTSYSIDTPSFLVAALDLVHTGNPYHSFALFNPPLGTYLEAPWVGLASLVYSPQQLLPLVPSILPLASRTAYVSPIVPSPAGLAALKLPLVASDVLTTFLLFALIRDRGSLRSAHWAAAAWFLNPLVIWISAIDGEVDGVAALFVVVVLWALLRYDPFVAGAALSLGTWTKFYPPVLLPLALFVLLVLVPPGVRRTRAMAAFALGLLAGILPFVTVFSSALSLGVTGGTGVRSYGGLTILTLYNRATPSWGLFPGGLRSVLSVTGLNDILIGLAVVGIALGLVGLWRARDRWRGASPAEQTLALSGVALWSVVGAILAYWNPEPENVAGLLGLGIVVAALQPRGWRWLVGWLSAAGFALVMAFASPIGVFYPAFRLGGTRAVNWATGVIGGYLLHPGFPGQALAISLPSLAGGVAVLAIWAYCAFSFGPFRREREVVVRYVGSA